MAKLENSLSGRIEIELSHPECRKVTIGVDTLPRYNVFPRMVIRNAPARQVVTKKIRIQNNYNEDFEIGSVYSKNNTVKFIKGQKLGDGYELELNITPPAREGGESYFSDVVVVQIKGQKDLRIPFNGFYPRPRSSSIPQLSDPTGNYSSYPSTPTSTTKTSRRPEDCKTCGPKIF
jgi:hypothetical protein